MGAGNYSLDPRNNKNRFYLICIIILIVMIAITYYLIIYLERTGATYKEQIVVTEEYLSALRNQ